MGPQSLTKGAMERFKLAAPPKPLPDLEFLDANDKPMTLADYNGKARLMNLWATWCAPCVKEMPSLDRLQAEMPRGQVLGAADLARRPLHGPRSRRSTKSRSCQPRHLLRQGQEGDVGRWASRVLPTSILVDPAWPRAGTPGGRRRLGQARRARADEGGDELRSMTMILPERGPLPSPKRSRFGFAQAGPGPLMLFWTASLRLAMSAPEARGPEDEDYERTWRSALRQDYGNFGSP